MQTASVRFFTHFDCYLMTMLFNDNDSYIVPSLEPRVAFKVEAQHMTGWEASEKKLP